MDVGARRVSVSLPREDTSLSNLPVQMDHIILHVRIR